MQFFSFSTEPKPVWIIVDRSEDLWTYIVCEDDPRSEKYHGAPLPHTRVCQSYLDLHHHLRSRRLEAPAIEYFSSEFAEITHFVRRVPPIGPQHQ